MFRFIALLPILSVAAHTGSRFHFIARQDVVDCSTPCTTLGTDLSAAGGDLSKLCSSTIINDYGACYNCEVQGTGLSQQSAQQIVDEYVNGCNAGGHPISSITIGAGGSSSSSSSTGSTSSNSSSTASGGSGSTTPSKKGGAVQTAMSVTGFASALVFLSFMAL